MQHDESTANSTVLAASIAKDDLSWLQIGSPALMLAAGFERLQCGRVLLEGGADPNQKSIVSILMSVEMH